MDFGDALVRLKDGSKMTRAYWPEGVYITLQFGYPEGIPINANTAQATELPQGTVCIFDQYFMECTPEGHFRPWEPKAVDVLAADWQWVSDANRAAPAPEGLAPLGAYVDAKMSSNPVVIGHNFEADGNMAWPINQLSANPVMGDYKE